MDSRYHHKPVGPVSYQIELENGRVVKRHQDHVRLRSDTLSSDKSDFPHVPIRTPTAPPPNRQQEQVVEQERVPRYPSRNWNPPNRLTYLIFVRKKGCCSQFVVLCCIA